MSPSVSLRKTLRTIPSFQSLPARELDTIATCLVRKDYRAGDRLWRAGTRLDFMGIIQKGEIVIEYRTNSPGRRSTRLMAGSFFRPHDLGVENDVSSVSAYAATDATLYVLRLEKLAVLRSKCPTLDAILAPASRHRIRRLPWGRLWVTTIAILVALFVWRDVTSAVSGILYLASDQLRLSADYQEALRLLDYAVRFDAGAIHAYNKEGYIGAQMGKEHLAATAFTQALNIDSTNGPALNNLAALYFTAGLVDQAIALQQNAAQADPNIAIIRYNLGLILIEQKDYVEAIRAFKEASRIDPDWALPYIQMSFVYLKTGDYAQAEQASRSAIHLDPAQQSAHLSLAIALYHQDRNQEALASFESALDITPDDVVSKFYKGLISRDMGETYFALLMLKQLLVSSNDPWQRARIVAEIEYIRSLQQSLSETR